MDACSAVEKEVERVINKFLTIQELTSSVVSCLTRQFIEFDGSVTKEHTDEMGDINDHHLTEEQIEALTEIMAKVNSSVHGLSIDHRDLHGTVSRVGKVIDRNFVSDFSALNRGDSLQNDENMKILNKIMAKHYFRQGMDDISDLLIKESKMPQQYADEVYESKCNFAEIYNIWKAILNYNLIPALKWAEQYAEELEKKNSALLFKLHRLAFLQILSEGLEFQSEAILYARKNFSKFIGRFEKEIQNLMGTFIYLPTGIRNSPYKDLISTEMWKDASYVFLKDSCSILSISKNSALSVVVNAGCTALPSLLNIKQVMLSRQVHGIWSDRDELPIEIDLESEYRYHSIFACPILRQQTSDENPPKKLTCGHVISNDALHKLSNGSILKCPYCPVEQNAEDAVRISF